MIAAKNSHSAWYKLFLYAVFVLFCSTTIISCQNTNAIYSEKKTIPSEGWHKDSAAVFTFTVTDTTVEYAMYVTIEHDDNYTNNNLWLFISLINNDGIMSKGRLEAILADEFGWFGKKSWFGNTYQFRQPYARFKFKQSGKHRFEIQQGMRSDVQTSIQSVLLEIVPFQKQ